MLTCRRGRRLARGLTTTEDDQADARGEQPRCGGDDADHVVGAGGGADLDLTSPVVGVLHR
jgi:hypothetical protein